MPDTPTKTVPSDAQPGGLDLGREALPEGGFYAPTGEELKQRKKRNLAIAAMVVAFILMVYFISMSRLVTNSKTNIINEMQPPPYLAEQSK